MKKILPLFAILLSATIAFAQSPESFNYQGVARDNAGNLIANQNVGLKFSILDSDGTTILYAEDWLATTSNLGLFNVQIGNGTVLSGSLSGIIWGAGPRFIKVEMDPNGGTAYQNLGTSQLLSVPYALHANSSDDGLPSGSAGRTLHHNGASWVASSNLFHDGSDVGIGTTTPSEALEINGNLGFSSSGRSIIAPGAFNIESTTGVDVIVDSDDNSTNSSFRVKRNSDGSEVIFEAMENGDVEVEGEYAYASSKTHYQSFSHRAFSSRLPLNYIFGQPGSTSDYGEFISGGTTFGYAHAAINLPDGAVITEVRAWLWDNSNANPVRVRLKKQILGADPDLLVSTVESATATALASVQELATSMSETIDNSTYSYHLEFTGKQNSTDTRLYAVRITYTVDQAD